MRTLACWQVGTGWTRARFHDVITVLVTQQRARWFSTVESSRAHSFSTNLMHFDSAHYWTKNSLIDWCKINSAVRSVPIFILTGCNLYIQNNAASRRIPRMRVVTSVMYLDYLVVGIVYFGLSLSSANFSTDPFMYMALTGLMEVCI